MQLPPLSDNTFREIPDGARRLVIIGANGSGKTRFTKALRKGVGDKAFRLSALEALYGGQEKSVISEDIPNDTIEALFTRASKSPAFLSNSPNTPLEQLVALLLNEEIANLVRQKVLSADGEMSMQAPTKLDITIRHWQEIFPDNHVLRQGGSLLFAKNDNVNDAAALDTYSQLRLSDGEKAVLYYFGAAQYAPVDGVIFVDNPGIFLHPTITTRLWDMIEEARPDCTFVYTTHDVDFAATRSRSAVVWVRSFNATALTWDYDVLPPNASGALPEGVYMAILGARRPVLFIEGDAVHSIDSKLYPLVFRDFTVKSLGSCNKVIESTRSFNDLKAFHHLESYGIVDRDRRDQAEVEYLRGKQIFVPEVAEIENILLLEGVIKAVAEYKGKDPEKVFRAVKNSIIGMFRRDLRKQALMHTRHRVKRTMEYRIDGRFNNINALEEHMAELVKEVNARGMYENFCREFSRYAQMSDYASVLRVYNEKSMLPGSNVAGLCGITGSKDAYVSAILTILRSNAPQAGKIRRAIAQCFTLPVPDKG